MSDVILAALDRDLAYVLFGYRVTENDLEPVRSSMRSVETGPGRARLLRFTRAATWSLCSVADPIRALREARRVLRPGGNCSLPSMTMAPARTVR